MSGAWMIRERTGNSGWVDTIWTFGLGHGGNRRRAAAAAARFSAARDGGRGPDRAVGGAARHLTSPPAPRRSTTIRAMRSSPQDWGEDAPRRMFVFLQQQAFGSVPLALSVYLAAKNPAPMMRVQDYLGFAIVLIAVIGEAIADWQLRQFQKDPAQSRQDSRYRPVGLVAPSELFLPVVRLAGLAGDRDRSVRRLSVRLARADRARRHVLGAALRDRRAASRGAYGAHARRRLRRLPAPHQPVLSQAPPKIAEGERHGA